MEPVTLIFNDEHFAAVASYKDDHFELIYSGSGQASSQNGIIKIANVNAIDGLDLKISFSEQMINQEYSCDNNAALSFLANVQSGKIDAAHQKLSSSLQNSFSANDIMSFIGKFDLLAPCRFTSFEGTCYAAKEKAAANVYRAKSYGFEFEDSAISNIIELDN